MRHNLNNAIAMDACVGERETSSKYFSHRRPLGNVTFWRWVILRQVMILRCASVKLRAHNHTKVSNGSFVPASSCYVNVLVAYVGGMAIDGRFCSTTTLVSW